MHLMIKHNGQARLTRCDHRQDSTSYQTVVLQPNLNFIRRVGAQDRRNPIVYQHDGASSHTSLATQRYLRNHRVQILPNWPQIHQTSTRWSTAGPGWPKNWWAKNLTRRMAWKRPSGMPGTPAPPPSYPTSLGPWCAACRPS
eukprot:EG_transcript_20711